MATLVFTAQLRRFVDAPRCELQAATLGQALQQVFAQQPRLRGYVLDDQGRLRPHIAVFIDGQRCVGAQALDQALAPDSQVHVLQALSGG
ncbi:MAG: MoaD/ThiS family protein [Burkholderiaceae bacterium]|nr:MoaD/ThiS family protein [Burkholderiaceae bacterium]